MQQYSYCRLPIVAPRFLECSRSNVFYYEPADDRSICRALTEAAGCDRSRIQPENLHSWTDIAARLAA
jgi:2-beta-glucuronyltransferase